MVEQRTLNPPVDGSSPSALTSEPLFGEARRLDLSDALAARMDDALARELSDVRIAQLDEVHALHAGTLIELYARVEQLGTPEAARLDRLVWQHLERHAERHRYDVNF